MMRTDEKTVVHEIIMDLESIEVEEDKKMVNQTKKGDESGTNKGKGKGKGKSKSKGKSNGENEGKAPKNPCKLKGHGKHDWEDCYNNPNSKNFKGKARDYREESEGKAAEEQNLIEEAEELFLVEELYMLEEDEPQEYPQGIVALLDEPKRKFGEVQGEVNKPSSPKRLKSGLPLNSAPEGGEMKAILDKVPKLPEGFSFGTNMPVEAKNEEAPKEEEEKYTFSEMMTMLKEKGYEIKPVRQEDEKGISEVSERSNAGSPSLKRKEGSDESEDSVEESERMDVEDAAKTTRFGPDPMGEELKRTLFGGDKKKKESSERKVEPSKKGSIPMGAKFQVVFSDDESENEGDLFEIEEKNTQKDRARKTGEKEAYGSEVLVGVQVVKEGSKEYRTYRGLIDTGSSSSLMNVAIARDNGIKKFNRSEIKWNTQAGQFKTHGSQIVNALKLPQFSTHRTFSSNFHMFEKKQDGRYDLILGRDILQSIGLDILNSDKKFEWNGILVDMVPRGQMVQGVESSHQKLQGESGAKGIAYRVKDNLTVKVNPYSPGIKENYVQSKILDANYEKIPLEDVVAEQSHLSEKERQLLLSQLRKNISVLECKRGKWIGKNVSFKLKQGTLSHCAKPYRIPQSLKGTLKKEIDRLVKEGVLSPVESSL